MPAKEADSYYCTTSTQLTLLMYFSFKSARKANRI